MFEHAVAIRLQKVTARTLWEKVLFSSVLAATKKDSTKRHHNMVNIVMCSSMQSQ